MINLLNKEKSGFSLLAKEDAFQTIISKLTKNDKLEEYEKSYILSSAIILSKYYEEDNKYKSYVEFAYYIILKYSILHDDYEPLYDFSINFGFFPIAKNIYDLGLINNLSINNALISKSLNKFKHNGYIETYEQKTSREEVLRTLNKETCFIAPTSFGKSSVILDYINLYKDNHDKICVIVPTRSLLMQTYRLIKEAQLERRIILHDEMYRDEQKFISIFTQERALRMLEKNNTSFDLLFIDEAHNLFSNNSRSILLARAIKQSKLKNDNLRVIYLSPLIADTENLKISSYQNITEQKIEFNIKEPEIFEIKLDGDVFKYNRFLNIQYKIGSYSNIIEYIKHNSTDKNFAYLRAPRKIEQFANELSESLPIISNQDELRVIIDILKQNVHEDFYAVQLLQKGIVYLHGKLPELIKEYLENKFRTIDSIKYVVANSVILEGMNLPIDSLFILNTYSLQSKDLTNLIGRVNRLNSIFQKDTNRLNKLLPKIHFVNSEHYNRKSSNMTNKIKQLRSRTLTDIVKNPVLEMFDLESISDEKDKKKAIEIIEFERVIYQEIETEFDKIKQYMIKEGFGNIYGNIDLVSKIVENRIKLLKEQTLNNVNMLDIIFIYFIDGIDDIRDFEMKRLREFDARNYYENHIKFSHVNTLKENITSLFHHFKDRISKKRAFYYIGESFGEFALKTDDYQDSNKEVYIDLNGKTDKELINLAIVKLELENHFIRYKLNKFIVMLHDFDLISNEMYNEYIYGTTDKNKIELARYGLSMSLISRLDKLNQLQNLRLNKFNNLEANEEFFKFTESVDDFFRYEILRNF